jgi:transcriptional regulator with XRE-family HTH domain
MNFKDKLLDLRKKAGLSQEELGNKLDISRQTISKWEMGKSTPELDKLVSLSEIFNVSLDELVKDIENSKENTTKKRTISKYFLLIIWIIICILLAFILYRYLSIRRIVDEYNAFMKNAKQNGGMVTIMNTVNSEIDPYTAYTNHYFKNDIEYIQYFGLKTHDGTGTTYLYKSVYKDKQNVYTIDEVNKTYTILKRMSYSDNGPLDEIENKINSNLLQSIFVKHPLLRMTFNRNYHTKLDKRVVDPNDHGIIGLQKGNYVDGNDTIVLMIVKENNSLNYVEGFYNTSDRTKIDANSYYYSNIGKTLELYLQIPDLTNYTLIENKESND